LRQQGHQRFWGALSTNLLRHSPSALDAIGASTPLRDFPETQVWCQAANIIERPVSRITRKGASFETRVDKAVS
jgi:hypothetical protein